MRVHGLHADGAAILQKCEKLGKLGRHKAQAVHSRVQLDMDGIVLKAAALEMSDERLQSREVRNARLQTIIYDLLEEVGSGGQNKNRQRDTGLPELDPLHG